MAIPEWNWLIDYASPHQGYMYGVKRHVYSGSTAYQRVDVVDTFSFGRCLVLDGKIQSSELDEYIYHEALIHPAMVLHGIDAGRPPEDALIMGGGEGAALRELLKYPSLKKIVMVDLDKEVVDICREYLPSWHQNSFDNSRVELLYMDARHYVEETDHKFDLVISDITEPVDEGPAYLLFTREFYAILKNRLKEGAVLSLQAGSFNLNLLEAHAAICNTLRLHFPYVSSYHTFIPSFDSLWGFILASPEKDARKIKEEEVENFLQKHKLTLKFYDGETHRNMFAIPKNVRGALQEEKRIIEDDNPLIVY